MLEINTAVEAVFREKGEGRVEMPAKIGIYSPHQGWSKTLAFRRVLGCGSMVACQATGVGRTASMTSKSTSSGSRSTESRSLWGRWPSGSAIYSARLRWNMN